MTDSEAAGEVLEHCRVIAGFSDVPGRLTRTYLSDAARRCQSYLSAWMERLGMKVRVDAAGNLRGLYPGCEAGTGRLLIGSHVDTVPDAGAYDGVLGTVLAIALVQVLNGQNLPCEIEVIGFSEEEGVRFGLPFIGSRALIGDLDAPSLNSCDADGITVEQAIRNFGLDPGELDQAVLQASTKAYVEFHIEQGPVLEHLGLPLAVVDGIVGQSRAVVRFAGAANHAGTTPMPLRKDALCAAAEWVLCVERIARSREGLVATVGKIEAKPGVGNAIPGEVVASLDVRHADDSARIRAFEACVEAAEDVAHSRGLQVESTVLLRQQAVLMHPGLTKLAERAIAAAGVAPHHMSSGAGHDAMIVARKLPCSMIFLRSRGGVSHSPDERVVAEDVALALRAGRNLLKELSLCRFHF